MRAHTRSLSRRRGGPRITLFQALVGCAVGCAAIVASSSVAAADAYNSGTLVWYVSTQNNPYICGEAVEWIDTDPAGHYWTEVRTAASTVRNGSALCGTAMPDVSHQMWADVFVERWYQNQWYACNDFGISWNDHTVSVWTNDQTSDIEADLPGHCSPWRHLPDWWVTSDLRVRLES